MTDKKPTSATEAETEWMREIRHHVRTPVSTLQGVALLLVDEPDMPREEAQQYLEIIGRETARLAAMTQDVLELASAWSGRGQRSPGRSDQLFTLLKRDVIPARIQYGTTIACTSPDHAFALGTSTHVALLIVTRMLDWLLLFTEPSDQIRIDASQPNDIWRIEVRGIVKGDLPQATRPYSELYSHLHGIRRIPEMGLGGPIVIEIAHTIGWTLGVTQSDGEELCLWADIPPN